MFFFNTSTYANCTPIFTDGFKFHYGFDFAIL